MAEDKNDPAALWRTMIGEMEKGFNAFANQAMASPEFSRVMNGVSGASAGVQKQLSEAMEKYFVAMNLPSRAQMAELGERLKGIESQLNDITTLLRRTQGDAADLDPAHAPAPRPSRTKQPPSAGGGQGGSQGGGQA